MPGPFDEAAATGILRKPTATAGNEAMGALSGMALDGGLAELQALEDKLTNLQR